jgi:hypothetical protein
MLLGTAAVVALVLDGGDDAALAVGPADGLDAGRLAGGRFAAVGRHHQPGPQLSPRRRAQFGRRAAEIESLDPGARPQRDAPAPALTAS